MSEEREQTTGDILAEIETAANGIIRIGENLVAAVKGARAEPEPECNADKFKPECMDFETWARAVLDRGEICKGVGCTGATEVDGLKWTAITRAQYEQEAAAEIKKQEG